jgi:hypothetical protein
MGALPAAQWCRFLTKHVENTDNIVQKIYKYFAYGLPLVCYLFANVFAKPFAKSYNSLHLFPSVDFRFG